MKAVTIFENLHCIHANIENADLFEGIWPIPDGVSLNSYIVQGEKTALIDLFKDWDNSREKMLSQISSLGLGLEDFDYLILNHMEPDHTGWLEELKKANPHLEILCTKKAEKLVSAFYGIDQGVRAVASGDRLDLGKGKSLVFYEIPNVHWPETMVTFEEQTGTLFSCDAFGSFGSLPDRVFDDQLTEAEHEFFEKESLRYYANIVSTFSSFVLKAIDTLTGLDIKVVAPSHGIIWRSRPEEIIRRYGRYASYMEGPAEKEITLIWSSMYGNTEKLLDSVIRGVASKGVPLTIHRVPQEHASYVLASAWKSSALIFGMPTYEYRMFPPMGFILDIFDRSHVYHKKVFRFGSFGWSGGAQKQFAELTAPLHWECLEPVEWQGSPG
ncbi:MAG: FprA family A-type flavoprotein, partial [Spirochaetales bacterium]|nr:FprA family A-type flavoprotein [Spirochaetales bacterium]